ncbi:MAG TPA: hypothetical protein PKE52_15900, partial [Bacteroidales bacterium]|nr:hypothetical protein [Bacteroidales bacterium]
DTPPAIQHLPNLTRLNGNPFNKMDLEEVSQPSLVGQDQPTTIGAYLMANPDFNHLANQLLDLSQALVTLTYADDTRVEEVD